MRCFWARRGHRHDSDTPGLIFKDIHHHSCIISSNTRGLFSLSSLAPDIHHLCCKPRVLHRQEQRKVRDFLRATCPCQTSQCKPSYTVFLLRACGLLGSTARRQASCAGWSPSSACALLAATASISEQLIRDSMPSTTKSTILKIYWTSVPVVPYPATCTEPADRVCESFAVGALLLKRCLRYSTP